MMKNTYSFAHGEVVRDLRVRDREVVRDLSDREVVRVVCNGRECMFNDHL